MKHYSVTCLGIIIGAVLGLIVIPLIVYALTGHAWPFF